MSLPANDTARQTFVIQRWITGVGVLLLIIKFTAYYLTNSVAILTDALESIVNVVAGFVSLYSLYVAAKPRDADHPYGHGKAEFLSAGVEGTLIILAGIWIIVEAISKWLHPSPIEKLDVGILLIAVSGAINFIIGLVSERTGRRNNSLAITATGKHLKSDAWSTVGLIAGLTLMYFSKLPWLDSAVAILFGGIIIFTGAGIVRKSIAGIMDEADTALLQRLVATLNSERRQSWVDLHNLRIIKYGNALHVDCHLTIPWYMNVHEAHEEIDFLGRLIKKDFGNSLEMFVHTDGCLPFSCKLCQMPDCPKRQAAFHKRVDWTMENIFENKKHSLETA